MPSLATASTNVPVFNAAEAELVTHSLAALAKVAPQDARILGKSAVFRLVDDDRLDEPRVGREAFVGKSDGGGRNVAETHCAPGFERRDPS